jgi:transposase
MPNTTFVEMSTEEQAEMLAALRRARYGYLLALHIFLWCAAGYSPMEIAQVLFCSRSSVYRTVRTDQAGTLGLKHDAQGPLVSPIRTTVLLPTLRRSLLALLKAPPRAFGWCRTRWSCATLALTLQTTRGFMVSAETRRRWLHELGWVWKRPQLVAKDDDPHRVARLARIRWGFAPLTGDEAMIFADARDSQLLPKVGYAWMPKGTQLAVMTPGQNQKPYLAGALDLATGKLLHGLGPRKTNVLFRALLPILEDADPATHYQRIYVVVDNSKIHKAKAVADWLAQHPRVRLLFLPTYCPRANPIERAFGDVHDCCPRHHQRKRLPDLVADVEDHVHLHGPWRDQLSDLYDEPLITAAVQNIAAEAHAKAAACVYQSHVD